MNKNGILWISATVIVIVFYLGRPLFRGEQPVSGTIGIEGKKITYLFPVDWETGEDITFMIRNANPTVTGYYKWRSSDGKQGKAELVKKDKELSGKIPAPPPGSEVRWSVALRFGDKETTIPYGTEVTTRITGKVSIIIKILYPLFIFIGALFAVRGGLEYFNPQAKPRLYTIVTTIFYICLGFFVIPVKNFMLLAPGPGVLPAVGDMFTFESLFYPGLWIVVSTLVFFRVKPGLMLLSGGIVTLLFMIIPG